MGMTVNVSCPECGYEKKLKVGSGMMAFDMQAVIETFHDEGIKEFMNLLKENQIDNFVMRQEIMKCETCNEYVSVALLNYLQINGKKGVVIAQCPECGGEVTEIEDENKCPKCKALLKKEQIGLWD